MLGEEIPWEKNQGGFWHLSSFLFLELGDVYMNSLKKFLRLYIYDLFSFSVSVMCQ